MSFKFDKNIFIAAYLSNQKKTKKGHLITKLESGLPLKKNNSKNSTLK